MTASRHAVAPIPDTPQSGRSSSSTPTFARLLRAEIHRLFARRFFRVLMLLGLIGYLVALGLIWNKHHQVTPADRAQAVVQRDQQVRLFQQQYRQCVAQAPQGQSENQCGTVPTADAIDSEPYLRNHPLRPAQIRDISLGIGVGVALLGFVIGATFIGAEWSSKNLVAWLFWEPRRLRLIGAKVLALLAVMLVLSVLAQLAFALLAPTFLAQRGLPVSSLRPTDSHFWTGVLHVQLRAGSLVLATALLGFGLANLIRNSAAAFGISFVYFAVVESLIRGLLPSLQTYLFTTGLGAWVSNHGINIVDQQKFDPKTNSYQEHIVHVSNLHGGVTLLIYSGAITVLSVWLFRRRDIG